MDSGEAELRRGERRKKKTFPFRASFRFICVVRQKLVSEKIGGSFFVSVVLFFNQLLFDKKESLFIIVHPAAETNVMGGASMQ